MTWVAGMWRAEKRGRARACRQPLEGEEADSTVVACLRAGASGHEPALGGRRALEEGQQHRPHLLLSALRGVRPILYEVTDLPDQAIALARRHAVGPQVG